MSWNTYILRYTVMAACLMFVGTAVVYNFVSYECAEVDLAQWGEWYDSSDCTKSCGCGSKEQERECPQSQCSNRICEGGKIQKKRMQCCEGQTEGTWGEWIEPAHCSKPCGEGLLQKHRLCSNGKCHGGCVGDAVMTMKDDKCSNGPCDDDVIRIRSGGMLSKVASIQKGSKKIVMLMYADTFLDEETHKFVEAIAHQAKYYRQLGEQMQAPTGCAFVVVACADDESMASTCKGLGLASGPVPQMVRIDIDGTKKYDADQLLHGKMVKEQTGGHHALVNLAGIDSQSLSKLNSDLAKAIEEMKATLKKLKG